MPGGNPPKPPSSSSSHSNRKSRWGSSLAATDNNSKSSASKAADDSKSKPSPKPSKDTTGTSAKPPTPKPRSKPAGPSPRAENSNAPVGGPASTFPFPDPPPPPAYGFHMLERRTIVLADGSVRSYFALPPDYQDFTPLQRASFRPEFRGPPEFQLDGRPFRMSPEFRPDFRGPEDPFTRARNQDYWNSLGPGAESSMKRKFPGEERDGRDGFERQRQQLLQYGGVDMNNGPRPGAGPAGLNSNTGRGVEEMRPTKYMRTGERSLAKLRHNEVDQDALKKAFLHFAKLVYENTNQKRSYFADGKMGHLSCLACNRSSKDFPDTHSLINHAYNYDNADSLVDHLGFHKALCTLMGWNYFIPPDNSKEYQLLSPDEAAANQDDLIMWPPSVLIHNSSTGKGRDGRMEGIGNRAMDSILRDLGFSSGKSMSLYSREGHLGIHVVKFASDASGLKEAERLSEYFEKDGRGRITWGRVQSMLPAMDLENNPNLVMIDQKTGEKKRIFYGHLATASDLDKVTFEIKKKVSLVSRREYMLSQ